LGRCETTLGQVRFCITSWEWCLMIWLMGSIHIWIYLYVACNILTLLHLWDFSFFVAVTVFWDVNQFIRLPDIVPEKIVFLTAPFICFFTVLSLPIHSLIN
jgi:hypothetical protein